MYQQARIQVKTELLCSADLASPPLLCEVMHQRREGSHWHEKGFEGGGSPGDRGWGRWVESGGVETGIESVPGTATIGASPIQSSCTVFRSNALCTIIVTPHPAVRPAHTHAPSSCMHTD